MRAGAIAISVQVKVFVDEPIAVVVQPITTLGGTWEDAAIIVIAVIADVDAIEVGVDRAVAACWVRVLDACILDLITHRDGARHAHHAIARVRRTGDARAHLASVIVRTEQPILAARAVGQWVGVALIACLVADALIACIARAYDGGCAHAAPALARVVRCAELAIITRGRVWCRGGVAAVVGFVADTLLALTPWTGSRRAWVAGARLTRISLCAVGAI